VQAPTLEEKVAVVKQKRTQGPVLLFGDELLLKALEEAGIEPVKISAAGRVPETSFFRTKLEQSVHEGLYPVLVACDMFGMRGIDYRSRSVPLHLIIAKSFASERNRDQGLNRCGRFGDPCVRLCFADTPLVDMKAA
jgi:hypothetical protein